METVTGVASRVILVLRVGALVLVRAEVHGNVAVVARELAVSDAKRSHVLVVEGGEGDGEAVEVVRQSEHLALRGDTRLGAEYGKGRHVLREEHGETISVQMCALWVILRSLPHLSADAELDGGHELTASERASTPDRAALALAVGGEADEVFVNDGVPHIGPLLKRSPSYA